MLKWLALVFTMIKLLLYFLMAAEATFAFTPPLDFILAEMNKRCVAGTTTFNGAITEQGKTSFATLTLTEGALVDANNKSRNLPLYFLSHWLGCKQNEFLVKNSLATLGIDIKKVSHGLFENEPVFIVGADAKDSQSPQLWIDKNNFVPVKEIAKGRITTFEKWMVVEALPGKKFPSLIITTADNGVFHLAISEKPTDVARGN